MKLRNILYSFLIIYLSSWIPISYADTTLASTKPDKKKELTVSGRVNLQEKPDKNHLVISCVDGNSYELYGQLSGTLETKAKELGMNNLFSLQIILDGRNRVSCEKSQTYVYNEENERTSKVTAHCIRYGLAEIKAILTEELSSKPLPQPIEDLEAEAKIIAEQTPGKNSAVGYVLGEIYGSIAEANINTPMQTITVVNKNKTSSLKQLVLLITGNTQIFKKIGAEEPIVLLPDALRRGQELTVVYSRDELKNEALYITITKE